MLTGVHLLDGKVHFLILEGLADHGLQRLWARHQSRYVAACQAGGGRFRCQAQVQCRRWWKASVDSGSCVCVCEAQPHLSLCDPMDCSPLGSSVAFCRQEYWSGLPFPSPGDLPHSGIKPTPLKSPALAGGLLTTEPPGSDGALTL